jgi:asparagine synthetase B (glutamine-hydrolysing)
MVGGIHTSDRFSNIPLFRETPGGNWLLVTGVPIVGQENLDTTLQKVVTGDYKSAYRTLAALDGAFAAVFWDNSNQKMLVVTDFLGMQPLYMFRRENICLMATDVKGITASGLLDIKMDPAGWGSFLSFGHLIGDLSLVEGIRRTKPASIYNIDGLTGSVEQTTYWHWPAAKPEMGLEDIDVASLVQMLRQDTMAYTQHTDQGTVLLSGGFDSRILLALLCEVGFSPDTLTVAHQDELFLS